MAPLNDSYYQQNAKFGRATAEPAAGTADPNQRRWWALEIPELLDLPVSRRVRLLDTLFEGVVVDRTEAGPVIRWTDGDEEPIGLDTGDLSELAGGLKLVDDYPTE